MLEVGSLSECTASENEISVSDFSAKALELLVFTSVDVEVRGIVVVN